MHLTNVIAERRSIKQYDPDHRITDEELKTLFAQVVLSPSSFNLQHWRFIVVRDAEAKEALCRAAFNQEQIKHASATIVVAAKLNAHEDAPEIHGDAPAAVRENLLPMIHGFYEGKPAFQRDEAIRSASLAAMTLMYVAHDMGYATGPMIGFDPNAVAKLAALDDQHIPVMLVVLGKKIGDLRPRAARLSLDRVVKLESLGGQGLT